MNSKKGSAKNEAGSDSKPDEHDESMPELSADFEPMETRSRVDENGPSPVASSKPQKPDRKRIGQYKILQKIAEGGMGAVYMAEQEKPIRRRVALKVIKAGKDSGEIIARFEAERQALAMMDHANIARIFDAGSDEDGSPFFVMELVQGIPITDYCDQNKLSIRDRLKLFIPVCKAVQHAHQKGIIHRDLKPSNVLVAVSDGMPVAKVIDFGLAKATEHQTMLTDKTMFTEFGQIVGTLQYMSPEQAEMNQLDIDTRTDVYSLGVMLYELLTGSTPLDRETMRGNALLRVLELIREQEPPRPSTRLSSIGEAVSQVSLQRKITQSRLRKILRGELDWIVMKSLDKDRSRRFETADQFADDIQRFIDGRAVLARPPSRFYQLKKFAFQHFTVVLMTLFVASVLVLATVVSIKFAIAANEKAKEADSERKVAEKEREGQKKVTNLILSVLDSGDPVFGQLFSKYSDGLGRTASIADVIQRISDEELADESELRSTPLIRSQLLNALGDIQLSYGDVKQSYALFSKANEIYDREGLANGAEFSKNQMGRGTCEYLLGDLKQSQMHLETAASTGRIAIELEPSNIDVLFNNAVTTFVLAAIHIEFENFDQADQLISETIAICNRSNSPPTQMLGSFADLYAGIAKIYRAEVGDSSIDFKQIVNRIGEIDIVKNKGTVFKFFGSVLAAEASASLGLDSTKTYEKMHEELVKIVGDQHFLTVLSRYGRAYSAARSDNFNEACTYYDDLISFSEKQLGRNHSRFAMVLEEYANLRRNNWSQASKPNTNDLQIAHQLMKESLEIRTRQLGDHRQTASSLYGLARIETGLKNYGEALDLYKRAMAIRLECHGRESKQVAICHFRMADVFQRLGQAQQAMISANTMLKIYEKLQKENEITIGFLGNKQKFVAKILIDSNSTNRDEIRQLLSASIRNMKTESVKRQESIDDANELLKSLN